MLAVGSYPRSEADSWTSSSKVHLAIKYADRISSSFELHSIEEERYSDQLIPTGDLTEPSRYD